MIRHEHLFFSAQTAKPHGAITHRCQSQIVCPRSLWARLKMPVPVFWLRYLPAGLRAKIEHRPNLQKILGNIGWLFFDKVLRMGMGLLVGVWVARYLGPTQFGLLNYATAIVALFTAVATLGLNNIVVRDLVKNPTDAHATLGTAFVLQLLGGGLALLLAAVAVTIMRPDDTTARVMVVIFGSVMVLKATDVIRYWFESKVQSKYIVWVENFAFLVFAAIKVVLILQTAPLMAFVWIVLAEAALVVLLLLIIYTQKGNQFSAWQSSYARAKSLLNDSWPLILSGLAAMIYMRIDQIMLGQMLSDEAVGIYSAAARLSEVWYFIPMAITSSTFSAIIEAKNISLKLYYLRLKKLFDFLAIIALSLAVIISFTSSWIIKILYGPGYEESALVLIIHIWAGIFVFMGVASSRWFILENLQKYTFYRTLIGGIVNILLNLILIPNFGVIGSAWATVIAQAVASVLFNAFNIKTRNIFILQLEAIFAINFFRNLIRLKNR